MNRGGGDRCAAPVPPARASALRDEQGAAAVEMALVLPLLLLLLFGIIDFGRVLNAQITLTEAAREGARAAALHLLRPCPRPVNRTRPRASLDLGGLAQSRGESASSPARPYGAFFQ